MKKQNRIDQLFKILSKKKQFITAKTLSCELGISEKTVYRLVRELNDNYFPELPILSEKGKGYRINEQFKYRSIHLFNDNEMSAEKRRENILERLLMISPSSISTIALGQEFFVSDSQILKDKQLLQKQLFPYNLDILSRKGELLIRGNEFDVRQAIVDLIPSFSTIDLDRLEFHEDPTINLELAQFLQSEIKKIEYNLQDKIPYPYNVNIFSHLYIMVNRILKVRKFDQLPKNENGVATIEEKAIYHESKRVVNAIEHFIYKKIPEIEVDYLYRYLISSRFQNKKVVSETPQFSKKIRQITRQYFDKFTLFDLSNIQDDSPIFVDLANHINPLLRRIENKIRIKNNMLNDIKDNYNAIFKELVKISKMVSQEYGLSGINDDEIGFLTLYFARFKEIKRQKVKVVIMCTTGIGTSELLKSKIENNFPEVEILAVTNYQQPDTIIENFPSLELLISTIDYPKTNRYRTIVVSALFTEEDKNQLRSYIRDINYEK
ncbi:BglG family transcription antiterminator [Streptococcus halotolerans]|uniref:BglG family transcription antiterminator n=1 Tax=Streptococcus halotolerans TaxID=1814128 RepID=UPI0007881833|nr:PRD domain-containing protein [Streptococcus halotolerans]